MSLQAEWVNANHSQLEMNTPWRKIAPFAIIYKPWASSREAAAIVRTRLRQLKLEWISVIIWKAKKENEAII